MRHRKAEYKRRGHDVTIQQVNEGGNISAWIDGWAMHADEAMDSLVNDIETLDTEAAEKVAYHRKMGEPWKAVKAAIKWMCKCHVYYCKQCCRFYDYKKVEQTEFAGHVCADCSP
jgi:hypothetical protein